MAVKHDRLFFFNAGRNRLDPFIDLHNFDEIVGILHPEYGGARLPEALKVKAKRQLEDPQTEYPDIESVRKVRSSLNETHRRLGSREERTSVNDKSHNINKKDKSDFFPVELRKVLPYKMMPDLLIYLDEKNRPLDPTKSQKKIARKIAVQVTTRYHYISDSGGVEDWALKTYVLRHNECLRKLGYEVVIAKCFENDDAFDYDQLAVDVWLEILGNSA